MPERVEQQPDEIVAGPDLRQPMDGDDLGGHLRERRDGAARVPAGAASRATSAFRRSVFASDRPSARRSLPSTIIGLRRNRPRWSYWQKRMLSLPSS